MTWLAELPELQGVFLYDTRVTDAGLVPLMKLKNLRYVWLPSFITDNGLAMLANIEAIEHVRLGGAMEITGEGFASWSAHPNLMTVRMWPHNPRVLELLKDAPKLKGFIDN